MDVFEAAWQGDLERVRDVVEQDSGSVHATDYAGWTPLLHAAYNGRVEVARYLLDHGATINHRSLSLQTALHCACCGPYTVLLLLQRGADVTAVDDNGVTPLIEAASDGNEAGVRALLEHGGSDVDAAQHDGRTACHGACSEGHPGVLRQLLEAGADPTLGDEDGSTSSDFAAESDQHECITVLQEWHRAYTLYRARSVRDVSLIVANSSAPGHAAPAYLVDRSTSGLTMPTVHVSPHQQHGQPSGDVGEEGHLEVEPVAVENMVTVYAIEELNGGVFVELMELLGITGCLICS